MSETVKGTTKVQFDICNCYKLYICLKLLREQPNYSLIFVICYKLCKCLKLLREQPNYSLIFVICYKLYICLKLLREQPNIVCYL